MKVRLDPWDAQYGSEFPLGEPEEQASEEVILDVEVPFDAWSPIAPAGTELPHRLIFVDGVRRLEARILARVPDGIRHGAFGSYAAGSVTVTDDAAEWGEMIIGRVAVLGGGSSLPQPVTVMDGLTYVPLSTESPEPEAPLKAILEQMRLAEERLARELADRNDTLVIADGPLTFADPVKGRVIGYIKRAFRLYLPPEGLQLLSALPAGSRTPIFNLLRSKRFARYSWFVRLTAPRIVEADLSGIVRLETADSVGLKEAQRLANLTAQALHRFVPGRSRDPRSPQNLLPIGALEDHLRRQLGHALLIRRHIESLIAQEVRNG
ncbi:MAG: hypothetical protein ACLQU2_29180 [Candidatus Binataceae bacterium]